MNKVFEQAKDLHVVATYVYVNAKKAYADEAHTKQLKTSELQDLFLKGAVIVDTNVLYKPTSLAVAGGVATVTYVKAGSTAPAAEVATAVSIAD